MATINAPRTDIFDSTALEQIFAKGVTARDNTAGLAYAFLAAEQANRGSNQDKYLGSLDNANRMASALAQQESRDKLTGERIKVSGPLIKEGFDPMKMPGGREIFDDGGDPEMTALLRALIQSNIGKNRSGGGAGGRPTTEVTTQIAGWGAPGMTTVKSKNADPNAAHAANAQAVARVYEDIKRNPQNYTQQQKQQVMTQMMLQSNQQYPGIVD